MLLILIVLIIAFWAILNDFVGYSIERSAWEYCNPFVILEGIVIFLIFNNRQIDYMKSINKIAQGSFTVYLLHSFFLRRSGIEKFVNANIIIMLVHIACVCIGIYFCCWIIFWVYSSIIKVLFSGVKQVLKTNNYSRSDKK